MDSTIISETIEILKKQKEDGFKIVGVVQHGIFPDELVIAAGAIPLRLVLGGKDEQEIGDQYLTTTTCPYSRSTLGFLEKKNPLYSLIDTMIVGTFCNGVQNIGNYLYCFQIPSYSIIIPHNKSETALNFYLSELKKLKIYLEKLTGNKITNEALLDAIKNYNEMRSLLRKINNFRKNDNPPVCGRTMHQIICESLLLGSNMMIPRLQNFLQLVKEHPTSYPGSRIFLTGSGITLGDSLLELIEGEGKGLIVADDLWSCMDYFLEDVDITNSDPLKAIAIRYLCKNLCGRMVPDMRIPKILELYHEFRASGIIYHTLKYCDSYSNLKPEFRKIMSHKNIPILELDRDYAESNVGQMQTRIEAFLEMIS